jgi:hypothetical protein
LSTSVISVPAFGVFASLHSETWVAPGPHGWSPHAQAPDVVCPIPEQQYWPVQLATDVPPGRPSQSQLQTPVDMEQEKLPQVHAGPAA